MKSRVFWVHSHPLTMRMRSTTSYWCTHVTINTKKYVIIVSSLQSRKMYYSTCIHIRGRSPEVSSILICGKGEFCTLLVPSSLYLRIFQVLRSSQHAERERKEKRIGKSKLWFNFAGFSSYTRIGTIRKFMMIMFDCSSVSRFVRESTQGAPIYQWIKMNVDSDGFSRWRMLDNTWAIMRKIEINKQTFTSHLIWFQWCLRMIIICSHWIRPKIQINFY